MRSEKITGPFRRVLPKLAFSITELLGSIEAFCDDLDHEISVPDTDNAVATAVAGNITAEAGSLLQHDVRIDSVWQYGAGYRHPETDLELHAARKVRNER